MSKIKVLHQVLNLSVLGGISSEYAALCRSKLAEKYDFIPMILTDYHRGLSVQDIKFYYDHIKKADPDIIHIRGAAIDGLNAVIAAKLARKGKILVTVHGMYSDLIHIHPLKKWISKYIVEKMMFGMADGISCVCKTANDRPYFDRYRHKMLPYVYNRIPTYSTGTPEDKRKARKGLNLSDTAQVGVFVGRMTKEKGLDYLVEAFRMLDSQWPEELHFLIVGDGNYCPEMEAECAKLKHSAKIHFCGRQENVEPYLRAGDFFVQPSLHENLSIAILEACAAGLPCLVTDVGGNREMIEDRSTGIIIPKGDAKALFNGLMDMSSHERCDLMKEKLHHYDFSRFSDEKVDMQLDEVYLRLMDSNKKKRVPISKQ